MATITIEVEEFSVPNTVQEKKGSKRTFNLEELDVDTLKTLCDNFRDTVFKNAGKDVPQ